MLNKLLQSALYSGLFTIFGGSMYFLLSLVSATAANGDVNKVIFDCFTGSVLCWLFLTYVFYEILGAFERLNEEGRKRLEERQKNEQNRNF